MLQQPSEPTLLSRTAHAARACMAQGAIRLSWHAAVPPSQRFLRAAAAGPLAVVSAVLTALRGEIAIRKGKKPVAGMSRAQGIVGCGMPPPGRRQLCPAVDGGLGLTAGS